MQRFRHTAEAPMGLAMGLDSWLIGGRVGRDRLLDMDRRLRPLRQASFGILGACAVVGVPWIGAWPLLPLALAAALFVAADRHLAAGGRPGPTIVGAWAGAQLLIAVAVVLAGGIDSPLVAWFALPIVTLSARFTVRGVVVGVLFTLGLLVVVAGAVDPQATLAQPPRLIVPTLLVGALALLSTPLMRSDIEHRSEATVDGLTGLPNRRAAVSRAHELAEQSHVSPQPVGLVLADVDRFKTINDSAGHAAGDLVLRAVAQRLREAVGRAGLVYRLSGEEFLILLPGADLLRTAGIAELLCATVRDAPVEGRSVTVSFGVAASRDGEPFAYDELFAAADAALYDAKRGGRDRVAGGAAPLSASARPRAGSAAA